MQERAADEERLGEDGVDGAGVEFGADRRQLRGAGADEEVAHVEPQRGGTGEPPALGERAVGVVEVDIGVDGQREEARTGGLHAFGIAAAREEAHVVAAGEEAAGDLQQGHDMAVRGCAGDEVAGHGGFFP